MGGDGLSVRVVATKMMGSLPVLRQYFDRCGIREVLDLLCPSASQATISHADAMLALVCNRLSAPQPLYRVEDWARETAVEECLGLNPDHLNDDRLAGALEAMAPLSDAIYGSIAALTIERFNVNTRIIHRDLTDIAFHGAYELQDQQFAQVMFGWPGANVPKGCKTLRQDVAVSADGSIPVTMRTYSGNAADVNTVVDLMEVLSKHAKVKQCLLVGDSKVLSENNLHRILLDECDILAPIAKTPDLVKELLALSSDRWELMPYLSERQQLRRERGHKVPRFYAQEREWTIQVPLPPDQQESAGSKPRTKEFILRKVYVLSEEERQAARASRTARMERAERELRGLQDTASNYDTAEYLLKKVRKFLAGKKLDHLYKVDVQGVSGTRPVGLLFNRVASPLPTAAEEKRLGPTDKELSKLDATARNYKTSEQFAARVQKVLVGKKVSHLYTVEVLEKPTVWPTSLTFETDQKALAEEERRDGLYALLTSVDTEELPTNSVIKTFKQQGRLEARHADLKGPLAVNPVFLKNNDRAVGLLLVIGLALLIYCLIERQARKELQDEGGIMQGLYPEGRFSRPTAKQILRRLSTMSMVGLALGEHIRWVPVPPDEVQEKLLTMLQLPRVRDS
jgi:transposase